MLVLPKFVMVLLVLAIVFVEWRRGYFAGLLHYLRNLTSKRYLRVVWLSVVGFIALIGIDQFLLNRTLELSQPFFKSVEKFGGWLGYSTNPWLVALAAYLVFLLLHRGENARIMFEGILSAALGAISCTAFKLTLLRARPNTNEGPLSFFNFSGLNQKGGIFQSFPSGDVVVVAGLSFLLFLAIRNKFLRVLFLLLPLTTAFSRISANRHWPSDTFFSLGLGMLTALFVWEYHKQAAAGRPTEKI